MSYRVLYYKLTRDGFFKLVPPLDKEQMVI